MNKDNKPLTVRELKLMMMPSFRYLMMQIDKYKKDLKFDIIRYPRDWCEDKMAIFLFDLVNFPLEQVIERFENEGGVIMKHSEGRTLIPKFERDCLSI